MAINEEKSTDFLHRFVRELGAAAAAGNVVLGDRSRPYEAPADRAQHAAEHSDRAGTAPSHIHAWLCGQVTGGYVGYHPADGTYPVSRKRGLTLTDPDGPLYGPGAFELARRDALLAYVNRLTREMLQETIPGVRRDAAALSEERNADKDVIAVQRRGRMWTVEFGRRAASVKDSVGMTYLAELLANPGYEISAIDLASARGPSGASPTDSRTGRQPVLDEQAKRAYRQRLSALAAEVAEHEANHDLGRAEHARAERAWLVTELASATGLAGRVRVFAGNEERARISVGKAIRRALDRIAAAEPVIAHALRTSIQTGNRCCYRPY
jgi:hypothetical protein